MANRDTDTGGSTEWSDGSVLSAADINDTFEENVSIGDNGNPTTPPVGAVVAWLKSFTGVPSTLPAGWLECDGSTVSDADSPLNGETLPDLNGSAGTQRFLRGSTTSGSTGGSETHNHSIPNAADGDNGLGQTRASLSTNSASTLPSYYEVVWIIRIK